MESTQESVAPGSVGVSQEAEDDVPQLVEVELSTTTWRRRSAEAAAKEVSEGTRVILHAFGIDREQPDATVSKRGYKAFDISLKLEVRLPVADAKLLKQDLSNLLESITVDHGVIDEIFVDVTRPRSSEPLSSLERLALFALSATPGERTQLIKA